MSTPSIVNWPAAVMPVAAVSVVPVSAAPYDWPSELVRALAIEAMVIVWFAFAPTWNCCDVNVPSSRLMPLNCVCVATRSISDESCETSCCRAARSDALFVALADCTASSRMRCRLSLTLDSAPSAVCASEMPSFALRAAWFRPRIWVVKRSEIARPAASSFALLMRSPEESRAIEVASWSCTLPALRCALSDEMLVLMVWGTEISSSG